MNRLDTIRLRSFLQNKLLYVMGILFILACIKNTDVRQGELNLTIWNYYNFIFYSNLVLLLIIPMFLILLIMHSEYYYAENIRMKYVSRIDWWHKKLKIDGILLLVCCTMYHVVVLFVLIWRMGFELEIMYVLFISFIVHIIGFSILWLIYCGLYVVLNNRYMSFFLLYGVLVTMNSIVGFMRVDILVFDDYMFMTYKSNSEYESIIENDFILIGLFLLLLGITYYAVSKVVQRQDVLEV
jgi:hypothetical protein